MHGVHSLNARVSELRKQLNKLGGTQENQNPQTGATQPKNASQPEASDPSSEKASTSPFPTIRNLPLLGAKYADYYRRAKIQETVFEMLTEQYELAKVQEAKETPSVKVLDPARVPEWKSYPPRLLITLLGMFLTLTVAAVWLIGQKSWAEVNPSDPRMVLAIEVAATLRAYAPWVSRNGDAPTAWPQKIWSRQRSHRPPSGGPSAS